MRRREFLTLSVASVGGALAYSLGGRAFRVMAQETGTLRVPLRFLTEKEAQVLSSAVSRIFPSDETGPGAQEAGVVIYIDRQLAGPWGRGRYRYLQGPFENDFHPELGYQGKSNPRELYRAGIKQLGAFDKLSPAEQDARLRAMEKTVFFQMLRQNTIEGMFCDPVHGGNIDMIGWQMIGFPGPRQSNLADIDAHFGQAFRPKPVSLGQLFGKAQLHPAEDES